MTRNGVPALVFHAAFVVFMLAPLAVVCAVAFTPEGYLAFPTRGLSLRWFRAIADRPEFIAAFRDSLWLGALSATLAIGLAVPAALAIARHRFPGREAVTTLFLSPLMVPHIVLGIAFLRFFTQIGLNGTFAGLVLSHLILVVPFALRLVLATSYGIDPRIEQAAVSLGAGAATVFRRVTVPLLVPGIVSGWVLAFITSFDEVTMTVFVASPATQTLPVRLFLYIQDNIDPLVCSISASLIAVAALAMIALDRAFGLDRVFLGRSEAAP